jgi:predicted nucleic acid-binding protein
MFTAGPYEIDLSRESTILDTNVVYARFNPDDDHHEPASEYLEYLEADGPVVVPVVVLVEAWGMLVGKDNNWLGGFELLAWLSNPGGPILLLSDGEQFEDIRKTMTELRVDCVDSFLYHLAHRISLQCNLKPPIRVATYDTRDVYKLMGTGTMRFRVFDMRSGENIDLTR